MVANRELVMTGRRSGTINEEGEGTRNRPKWTPRESQVSCGGREETDQKT